MASLCPRLGENCFFFLSFRFLGPFIWAVNESLPSAANWIRLWVSVGAGHPLRFQLVSCRSPLHLHFVMEIFKTIISFISVFVILSRFMISK